MYNTFQKGKNKGADQTARTGRLVCACVVRNPPKAGFMGDQNNLPTMPPDLVL